MSLAAGVYFVRVFPAQSSDSEDTNYTLRLADDLAGNTLGSARNVGTLPGTAFFGDSVGLADTNDYYRIFLPSTRTLNVQLTGLMANADLQLIRDADGDLQVDDGEVIGWSFRDYTSEDSITATLGSGVYFVRVYEHSGDTSYTLRLTDDLPGNTLGTARGTLGILSGTAFVDDFVGAADTDDYYRVGVSPGGLMYLSLTGLSADADLQVIRDADEDLRWTPGR